MSKNWRGAMYLLILLTLVAICYVIWVLNNKQLYQ